MLSFKYFKFSARILIIAVMVIVSAGASYAARPLVTEDATVAGYKVFQLELSADFISSQNNDFERGYLFKPIYGLSKDVELSFEIPRGEVYPAEDVFQCGQKDILANIKVLCIPETKTSPAFLIKGTYKFAKAPAAAGLGTGANDIGFLIASTKNYKKTAIHANIGCFYCGRSQNPDTRDYLLYGIAATYELTQRFSLASEFYGQSRRLIPDDRLTYQMSSPLIGFTYRVSPSIVFDAAVRFISEQDTPYKTDYLCGLSMQF